MNTKILSLPILVLISLTFLASCTAGMETDKNANDSASGMTEISDRGNRARPPREGRGRHENTHSGTIAPTRNENTDTTTSVPTAPLVSSPMRNSPSVSTPSSTSSSDSPATTITKSTTYSTDHNSHQVAVNFTISTGSDGTITAVTAKLTSGDRESAQYISRFNSAAKSKIFGKKISSLSLSAVGGASDTTNAFQEVISSL